MVAGANVRRLLLVNFLVGRDPAGNTGDPLAASWIPAMALVLAGAGRFWLAVHRLGWLAAMSKSPLSF